MLPKQKSNPTEVVISPNREVVQRSIVFRNISGKDFVLKLIPSKTDVILFPTTVFRFPPTSYRTIQFRVDTRKLSGWDKHNLSIKGFVLPVYSKDLKKWIESKNAEGTCAQLAFNLKIKFSDEFSAPQIIVNLPGNSSCIDSTDHPVDVEELDTYTAVNIEKDVATAVAIGSMMNYVDEYKRMKKANKSCWLTDYVCGKEVKKEEKSAKSSSKGVRNKKKPARSTRSSSCSSQARQPNFCLDAAPCGGSTIQS